MPQVTAAKFPIPLEGETLWMSPLVDRDIDELDNWLRASFIQMDRDSLVGVTDRATRDETLELAMTKARTLSWMQGEGAQIAGTLEGITMVLWKGIVKNHPELTYDQLKAKMRDPLNAEMAMKVWEELNVGKRPKEDPKKARASRTLTRGLRSGSSGRRKK